MGRVQRQSGAAAVAMLVVVVVSVAAVAAVVVVVVVLAVVVVVVVVGRHQVPGEAGRRQAGRPWAGRRRRISLASTDSNLRHRIYTVPGMAVSAHMKLLWLVAGSGSGGGSCCWSVRCSCMALEIACLGVLFTSALLHDVNKRAPRSYELVACTSRIMRSSLVDLTKYTK
jgi:hypothetical protein